MRIKFCNCSIMSIFVTLLIMMFVSGCRTTRYIPVETIIRDTTTFAHWDSIVNEKVKVVRDSLLSYHCEQRDKLVKDSTYIKDDVRTRVDQDGKVIGKDSIHIEYRNIYNEEFVALKDSVSRFHKVELMMNIYKLEIDSLNRVLHSQKQNVVYIKKDLKGIDLFFYRFGQILTWICGTLIIGFIVFIIVRLSRK